ncbi:DOWNY MILDEW RESISTANCE 6 protein [Nymphaea thermarum]|nr:DOWNY MILDEW RESISTANCE 6 protein [Nymphaea thermarum]
MTHETLLSSGISFSSLPDSYVRPPSERPRLSEVLPFRSIPIIDLASPDRSDVVRQVRHACASYGFFQIVNHGMPGALIENMLRIARNFFRLPIEEKMKLYSDDPSKKLRLSTSFNIKKETVNNWRDYLRLHCHPLEEFIHEWPTNPPDFRDVVGEYSKEARELAQRVMKLISLSLGLREDYLRRRLGAQAQHMAINYYPLCPQPELTYGLPGHTDPNALTILLQDGTAGLQVMIDQQWLAVDPVPGAFVVNIGDQIQALSNAKYRSVWHRAVVNSKQERMSIATFMCPGSDAMIEAAEELAGEGEGGLVYRSFTYDEYYKQFWSRSLDDDHCLEFFKR